MIDVLYLLYHTGHYAGIVIGIPDDLKAALQKMDDLTKEEGNMINAYTLVTAEKNLTTVETVQCVVEKVQHVQGMSLLSGLIQGW